MNCKICNSKTYSVPNTNGSWIATDGGKYVENDAPICPECASFYTKKEVEEKLNKVTEEK